MLTLLSLALAADSAVLDSRATFLARWGSEPLDAPAWLKGQPALEAATGAGEAAWGWFELEDGVPWELARVRAEGVDRQGWTSLEGCGEGCEVLGRGEDRLLVLEQTDGLLLVSAQAWGVPTTELLLRNVEARPVERMSPATQALWAPVTEQGWLLRYEGLRTWAIVTATRVRTQAAQAAGPEQRNLVWLAGNQAVTSGLALLGEEGRELEDLAIRQVDGSAQVVASLSPLGLSLRRRDREAYLPRWEGPEAQLEVVWVGDLLGRVETLRRVQPLPSEGLLESLRTGGPGALAGALSRPSLLLGSLLREVDLPRRGLRGARVVVAEEGVGAALDLTRPARARRVAEGLLGMELGFELEVRGSTLLLTRGQGSFGDEEALPPGLQVSSTVSQPLLPMLPTLDLQTRVERGAVVVDLGEAQVEVDWGPAPMGSSALGDQDACYSDVAAFDLSWAAALAAPEQREAFLSATAELMPPVADDCAALWPQELGLELLQGQAHASRGVLLASHYEPAARAHLDIGCGRGQALACELLHTSVPRQVTLVRAEGVAVSGELAAWWGEVRDGQLHAPEGRCGLQDRACLTELLPPVPTWERRWLGLFLPPDLDPQSLAVFGDVTRQQRWEWVQAVEGPGQWPALQLYPLAGAEVGRHALVRVTDHGWEAVSPAPLPPLISEDPAALAEWVVALSAVHGYAEVAIEGATWGEVASTASILRLSGAKALYMAVVVSESEDL